MNEDNYISFETEDTTANVGIEDVEVVSTESVQIDYIVDGISKFGSSLTLCNAILCGVILIALVLTRFRK